MIPYCILAIEDDDDRAFMEGLVHSYERLVYSEIRKITTDSWAIDDIYQIAWERLIDKIALLRSRGRNQLVNYIISTAKNTARNYIRDYAYPKEAPFEDYLDISGPFNDDHHIELRLMKTEELECLARAWPGLDERSRYILEGYYILERPMEELARELGIQPKSIRMALTRARKNAYALLKKELEIKK